MRIQLLENSQYSLTIPQITHSVISWWQLKTSSKVTESYTAISRKGVGKSARDNPEKGIVGGFVFTVFQRNLKEWHKRPILSMFASVKGKYLQQLQCIDHIQYYLLGMSPADFLGGNQQVQNAYM